MSWWKKMLITFGLFAVWFCGLIIVGGWGFPSQYFWTSGTFLAVGFAVAPFWRFRKSIWFWSTTMSLEVANLAFLYVERDNVANPDLPSKGIVQGLLLLDVMGSWGIMVGVCWLISRKFPWQQVDE